MPAGNCLTDSARAPSLSQRAFLIFTLTQLLNASSPAFRRSRRKELLPSSPSTAYILLLSQLHSQLFFFSSSSPSSSFVFILHPPHLEKNHLLRPLVSVAFIFKLSSRLFWHSILHLPANSKSSHIFFSQHTLFSTARLCSRRS
ncbi:hypothetical protein FBEOM_8492 [Fusarium beomiforme]|uniref:Uncharacterized protein n=1 Tax=Fusarium beomiforme TaxID=44412 RepID=A0A9P5AF80_9HYPO|nr:hypothetical protein FBEOM_8492 [Fusarium beomiforme]